MRRYIIIIGAMKSGTTTLFDALARHPAIAPASNKEPGFFAFDDIHAKGYDWFDTLFDFDPAQHQYRLEASTDYTKAPFVTGVWDRMTADPEVEVKLLYIMRHPLRRLESHARHTETARREIGQQISPRSSHSFEEGISPVSLATSAYAQQLDHYQTAWSSGRLHCLTLEELKSAPAETLAEIWRFLALDPPAGTDATTVPASNMAVNKQKTSRLWETLTAIKPLLAAAKAVLPSGLQARLRDRFRTTAVVAEGRFALSPEETAFFEQIYQDDIARLQAYGIDTAQLWGLGDVQSVKTRRVVGRDPGRL